jgi:hypothetical protein
MRITANLLWSLALRRHPSPELLQACADLELSGVNNRLIRWHARACEHCQDDLRFAQEILDLFRAEDVCPADVALVRERVVHSMCVVSADQQVAINDVRRLLGTRAFTQLMNGKPTVELRNELAAFLGHHAADSILQRMAA